MPGDVILAGPRGLSAPRLFERPQGVIQLMMQTWDVFRAWVLSRVKSERGANLVEYILLIALIALLVIASVQFLRGRVSNKFNEAGNAL